MDKGKELGKDIGVGSGPAFCSCVATSLFRFPCWSGQPRWAPCIAAFSQLMCSGWWWILAPGLTHLRYCVAMRQCEGGPGIRPKGKAGRFPGSEGRHHQKYSPIPKTGPWNTARAGQSRSTRGFSGDSIIYPISNKFFFFLLVSLSDFARYIETTPCVRLMSRDFGMYI
jgi:hypothetical protein